MGQRHKRLQVYIAVWYFYTINQGWTKDVKHAGKNGSKSKVATLTHKMI